MGERKKLISHFISLVYIIASATFILLNIFIVGISLKIHYLFSSSNDMGAIAVAGNSAIATTSLNACDSIRNKTPPNYLQQHWTSPQQRVFGLKISISAP